jgi:hypothetical protein
MVVLPLRQRSAAMIRRSSVRMISVVMAGSLVYGVNTGAIARISRECPSPPCVVAAPPPNPCVDAAVGPFAQDCQSVPYNPWSVVALCVDHQCRTYVPATGSE